MPSQDVKELRYPKPIGTLQELEAVGFMDPGEYFTCGPPSKENGVLGCPMFHACKLNGGKVHGHDFKGEKIRGVAGPEYFGIQELANKSTGRKVINSVRACFELPDMEERAEASRLVPKRGSILRIIARQGESININTHGPKDEEVPGQGKRRTWHPEVVPREVPRYPRPNQNPALGGDQFAASEAAKYLAERTEDTTGRFFGDVVTEARTTEKGDGQGKPEKGKPASRG